MRVKIILCIVFFKFIYSIIGIHMFMKMDSRTFNAFLLQLSIM